MKCPFCRTHHTEIYNSRSTKFGSQTWRRRRCLACGKSFTTYEAPDLSFLKVTRTPTGPGRSYSRAELFSSLFAAFEDVPRKAALIDAVTDTVESKLLDLQQPRITTREITDLVLTTLKHFHTAAFIRYLSLHAGLTSTAAVTQALRKY
jgi:transcriptional repressor NrdR